MTVHGKADQVGYSYIDIATNVELKKVAWHFMIPQELAMVYSFFCRLDLRPLVPFIGAPRNKTEPYI